MGGVYRIQTFLDFFKIFTRPLSWLKSQELVTTRITPASGEDVLPVCSAQFS